MFFLHKAVGAPHITDKPHMEGQMFTTEVDEFGIVVIDVTGKIDAMAMETGLEAMLHAIEGMDHLDILYRVHQIDLPTLGAIAVELQHLPALFGVLAKMRKVALIADQQWIETVAKVEASIFRSIKFAYFEPGQEDAAKAWLQAA
jgi:SpoIIAA-like